MTDRIIGHNVLILNAETTKIAFQYFLNSILLGRWVGPVKVTSIKPVLETANPSLSIEFEPLSEEERNKIKQELAEMIRVGELPEPSKTEEESLIEELDRLYGEQHI